MSLITTDAKEQSAANEVSTGNQVDNLKNSQAQEVDELDEAEMARRARSAKHHKKWNRRLKIFFCCLGYKKNKDSIADVASIFAEFYADLNVPSSDIAAGFVLLSKYQDAQRQWIVKNQQLNVEQYLSSVPITSQSKFLDISTAEDSHLINDLIYYMNYSLAIFGWPMQVVDDPCMLCCIYPYLKLSICCGKQKRSSSTDKVDKNANNEGKEKDKSYKTEDGNKNIDEISQLSSNQDDKSQQAGLEGKRRKLSVPGELDEDCNIPIILEDNCCGCNVASVERRLAAHNYEIIYVSYKVNVNVVPFLIAADHSKQSIVVAIRGSMSLSDMVTDMNGQTDKLPIDDCPDDWLCHRGITRAASYVKSTLLQEHILDRAYNCRPDLGSQGYNLILCGHSLGAGVAAILGILLRKHYPSLKAYLYSPPGGILSLPVVEYTKQFATGIILGNDCVPRLGIAQLERLRYHILLSLKSSQKSTGKILAKALCPSCCFGGNKVDYDPSQSLNLLHGTGGRSFDYNNSKIPFQVQPQVLYVPGRIIHIVKNHTFKSKARRFFNEPIYQAVWNDNTEYDRIMVSEGMFYDHLPNNLMHAMKMLFSKTLPARKESKESLSGSVERAQANGNPDSMHEHKNDVIREIVAGKQMEQEPVIEDDNNNNKVELDENNNDHSRIVKIPRNDLNRSNSSHTGKDAPLEHGNIRASHSDHIKVGKIFDDNGNDETISNNNHE